MSDDSLEVGGSGGGTFAMFKNRFFVADVLLFVVLWGVATVTADYANLDTQWVIIVGIVVGEISDQATVWLQNWRVAKQEARR